MKIEKVNEDKIRITLNVEDLKEKDIDFHAFMSNSAESQELFLDMLEEAEKEVGFVTDDYRVMIEALAMSDGNFVLTVTRLSPDKEKGFLKKKRVHIRRKNPTLDTKKAIYCFDTFDEFCEFCQFTQNGACSYAKDFATSICLYQYQENYYLVFTDIQQEDNLLKPFCSSITEFAHLVNDSSLFERKLLEYGTLVMKDNAIQTCMTHFCS